MARARARTQAGATSCAAAWTVLAAATQPIPNSSMPSAAGAQ